MTIRNTMQQLNAAGGGIAIATHYCGMRTRSACGWNVWRIGQDGEVIPVDPGGPWFNYGRKVFYGRGAQRAVALEQAKAWVAEKFGERGPWARNAAMDYVPRRINKSFPIRKS